MSPVLKVRDPNTGSYVPLLGASSSDHGALQGLGDDDHPQYLRADGTREATSLKFVSAAGTKVRFPDIDTILYTDNASWPNTLVALNTAGGAYRNIAAADPTTPDHLVTKRYADKYAAMVYRGASQALTDSTSYTVVFDTFSGAEGGSRYKAMTVASNGITIPIEGMYYVDISAAFTGSGTGARIKTEHLKSGGGSFSDVRGYMAGNTNSVIIGNQQWCTAGQVMGVRVISYGLTSPSLLNCRLMVCGPL